MCDYLISFGNRYDGKSLFEFLKVPYGKNPPEGKYFNFPWGSVAILEERLAQNNNIIDENGYVRSWIGDLVIDDPSGTIKLLIGRIKNIKSKSPAPLENDELFKKLNGAFTILTVHANGFSIITDPMNFTPVYVGRDLNNNVVSYGTHPDLVACISRDKLHMDPVSAAEYLSYGNSTFPNTMHSNVKEINPGCLHNFEFENNTCFPKEYVYWKKPEEIRNNYDEEELAEDLKEALVSAVRERCNNKKVAVLLSGGLDSRLIMALVPDNIDCFGLTFSESFNREVKTAKKVAICYKRDWKLLTRDSEFLADHIEEITKYVGCECEWVSSHVSGFAKQISEYNVDRLLSGQMFDTFLKAYFAFDFVRKKQVFSLLPATYEKISLDYVSKKGFFEGNDSVFWTPFFTKQIAEGIHDRREEFYKANFNKNRRSIELLFWFPFSQFIDSANWFGDRRILPVQLVGFDRRLLDFAFRCPVELKLNGKIFVKAATKVYGPGARVCNANDGVRPGSSHFSRIAQRAVRKTQYKITKIFERMGRQHKVQHSWSNYEEYWKDSKKLKALITMYGMNLDQFKGQLFSMNGRDLLSSEKINWRNGFRLLHLAVWAGTMKDYYKRLQDAN